MYRPDQANKIKSGGEKLVNKPSFSLLGDEDLDIKDCVDCDTDLGEEKKFLDITIVDNVLLH